MQSEAEINRYNLHFKLLNYQWNAGACGRTQDVSHRAAIALIVHVTIAQASDQHHIGLASFTGPRQLRFFFGCTFDLVSGWQCICACAVPHPLCTWTFEKGVLSKTTARKTGCKKRYSSGDFKQQGTSDYDYNVLSMNCEQDWKVSAHCSLLSR